MSDVPINPDYHLDDIFTIETDPQLKAVAEPTRRQILDLVLERAASVTELAAALDRPKSSVAYHVDLLESLGLLKVVRTRKVRALEERFYGRTARTLKHGSATRSTLADGDDWLLDARAEARPGTEQMRTTLRHVRIPDEAADEFFDRVAELAEEFTRLDRKGDTIYGFVASVYPTDLPTLPEAQ